jgi:polyhydroxybutyrate depolymerase
VAMRSVRRSRVAPGVLLLVALSAACSGSSGPPPSGSRSGSAQVSPSGTGTAIGGQRPVTVRVPSGYQKGAPAPLLVLLHGHTSDAAAVNDYFHLQPVLDERGVLYVVPNGTRDSAGDRFWNATDACCDFYGREVDDSGYLQDVIHQAQDRVQRGPTADLRRRSFQRRVHGLPDGL